MIRKPLLKRDIEIAQSHTLSASAAARYLGVSYLTYKKYAKLYGLHESHKNPSGKGIKKVINRGGHGLKDILDGKHPNYNHRRLKERIIHSGLLPNECGLCGYNQSRPDGKVPLQLYCKDGDRHNLKLDNLELRCFNCYYLTVGKVDAKLLIGGQIYQDDFNERLDVEGEDIDIEALQREVQEGMENGIGEP